MPQFQNVVEKVVYKRCDENPDKTIAIRSAWIDSQVFGFSRAIRSFGFERFKKNCAKMVRSTRPSLLHSVLSSFSKLKRGQYNIDAFRSLIFFFCFIGKWLQLRITFNVSNSTSWHNNNRSSTTS